MSTPPRPFSEAALVVMLLGVGIAPVGGQELPSSGWTHVGGNRAYTRYSPLDQIDGGNVHELRLAWRRPGVDASYVETPPDQGTPPQNLSGVPIFIDGVLYAPNGRGLIEAFHPGTGRTIWVQETFERTSEELSGPSVRGVEYWTDGVDRRLVAVRNGFLYTLDPATGRIRRDFGENGRVSLVPPGARTHSAASNGPIVVQDVVVVAGTLNGAGDSGNRWMGTPSEDVRGYDVRTGELLWTFHVVPRVGEFGVQTWESDAWMSAGDQGSWCCMSADEELGYVYVPLGSPTSSYYGGHRPGDNLFSSSLVALNARTGQRVWHFQMVHHDIWEYDTVGPPTLGEIIVEGRRIDAVMQPSKTGFLYVFDRETGEPVWPIVERPVQPSPIPGEYTSPTQPFPTKPAPFARQAIAPDSLIDFTPELRRRALAFADSFQMGSIFTPPPLVGATPEQKFGSIQVPGVWGAGNWNNGAFDPETGTYYAVSHELPFVVRIRGNDQGDDPESEMQYWGDINFGRAAEEVTVDGIPIVKPPWGRITAIDMHTGEHRWMVANGDPLRDHPALRGMDLPDLGVSNRPAPLLTRTLLFIGEGSNVLGGIPSTMWGTTFRAYDKSTGVVLWQTELDAGTTGAPMSYMFEGKQYIVVAIGAREYAAEWVALALP
jgi:quinoprotein glucose dehydrogenase